MADELQPIETPESIAKMYGIEPPPAAPTRPTVPSGPFAGMPVPKEPGGMGGPGVNLAPKPAAPVAAPTPTSPALTPERLAKEYGIGQAVAPPGGTVAPPALAPRRPLEQEKLTIPDPNTMLGHVLEQYPGFKKVHSLDTTSAVYASPERIAATKKAYGTDEIGHLEYWRKNEEGMPGLPHPTGGKGN